MKHVVLGLFTFALVVGLVQSLAPQDLWAHGGQWRGPGDAVPPKLREPSDPTPPPPPPPSEPPQTPSSPPTGVPTRGPTTGPTSGPPRPVTPLTSGARRRPNTQLTFEDWVFWYAHNKEAIERLKWALYHKQSSENPIFVSGQSVRRQSGAEMRWTQKKVREVVVPALLWALEEKNADYADVEGAAYIALAKVTRDPAHIPALMAGLDRRAKRHVVVRESAALALGMLRRADAQDQFSARELDRVRAFLFDVFEDEAHGTRTRGFAAVSVGLLGDQPTGSGSYANDGDAAARATTQRLFDRLGDRYPDRDLDVSLLLAIGLQPPTSLLPDQRATLAECALKGRLGKDGVDDLVRSYAALALGRVGSTAEVRVLRNVLSARREAVGSHTRRSATIGLGLLGRLVSGADRVQVAEVLLRAMDRSRDHSTTNFGLISLAYLLIEDIRARTTDVIGNTRADEVLLETAKSGGHLQKGFAALALGLVLRQIGDDVDLEVYQDFRKAALTTLREGVESRRLDKRSRAAFCTAAGIARDDRSREALREILDEKGADKNLRSYAALGLGLMGTSSPEVHRSIAAALRERSSDDLRRQAAVALGLLGNPKIGATNKDAVDVLLDELKDARTQSHKGQIVVALSRVGDHRAVDRLVHLLKDPSENDLTRALACAGLGLVGDLEELPSLSRASRDVNYRASTDLINELLSIL